MAGRLRQRRDFARRIAAFEVACRTTDLIFGDAYAIPKIPRPSISDRQNPMEVYDDAQFLARYRFSKETVLELLSMLPLPASRNNRGLPLPPLQQLLLALRFYGAGSFQVVTGDLIKVSQPTVCRTVRKGTELIASHLFERLVHLPEAAALTKVMRDFYNIAQFPVVTGCIDCTHIEINSPGGYNAEVYRNRKGYFSINMQAVTGPNLEFFDVVASWPGSVHDSRIFENSRVRVRYEGKRLPGVLLGDMGYSCQPFLMTPLGEPVERAFGVWKRRFPCLDMCLQHKLPQYIDIITACAALHNLACAKREAQPPQHPRSANHRANRGNITQAEHLPPVTDGSLAAQAREMLIIRSFS
ncbi:hypothetical protein HPB48_020990 [Haemaphysalis longicornis]|uniref:DDE Tnp4 domain-containing protein n=1 Tax=Haemaphysalis longicornis TaxID=44386 RepID=A0A9J6FA30_HAELO|nr:hypothetical protein HPB48_020990 [Haemaphysalis longicornis]